MTEYEFIQAEKASFPVRAMCRALDASKSGYYDSRRRAPSKRQQRREELAEKVSATQRCHGPFALRYFGGLEYLRQNGAPRFWVSEELVLQENEPAEVPRFDGRS